MFCGQLPFTSRSALELVHCHIAARPPTPEKHWKWAELPAGSPPAQALNRIILQLMAKNKEDRYQSATGVRTDLELLQAYLLARKVTHRS